MDTQGFLLAVSVQAGDVQDRDGAKEVLCYCKGTYPRLSRVWADAAYGGALVDWVKARYGWALEIVRKSEDQKGVKGFAVQPHRWAVERTFAWLCKSRRLGRDYEFLPVPAREQRGDDPPGDVSSDGPQAQAEGQSHRTWTFSTYSKNETCAWRRRQKPSSPGS